MFLLGCVIIRIFEEDYGKRMKLKEIENLKKSDMKVYYILVKIYREKEVVEKIIEEIKRINWKRRKIEIKIV